MTDTLPQFEYRITQVRSWSRQWGLCWSPWRPTPGRNFSDAKACVKEIIHALPHGWDWDQKIEVRKVGTRTGWQTFIVERKSAGTTAGRGSCGAPVAN